MRGIGYLAIVAMVGSVAGKGLAADAGANRKASAGYEAVVTGNPVFRANREHVECDPIESLDLRAQCVASFEQASPIVVPVEPPPAPLDLAHPRVTVTNGPIHNPDDD